MMLRFLFVLMLMLAAGNARADAGAPVILVLGDSLSAAYGIPVSQGWVTLLQQRLQAAGYPQRVINASVSGETTSGGLNRLPALLDRHRPQLVLVELGANDGLRGLPVERLADNLKRMVGLSHEAGARAILFEMYIPTNYGQAYSQRFTETFHAVAKAHQVPLVPFWLAQIALDPDAFQDDGIHPTASVQAKMLDAVWPTLETALKAGKRASARP